MKKISSLVIVTILILVFLGACANNSSGSVTNTATPLVTKIETVLFPYTVKDINGYKLTLTVKPQKVISLTLATDEILPELVDLSVIQSMTTYSLDEGVSNILDIAKKVPLKIDADVEKIISMKPDLVFVADWKEKKFVQQLRNAGIKVFQFKSPATIQDVKQNITDISRLLGETEKGQKLINSIDEKLSNVDNDLKSMDPTKKLTVMYYYFAYGSTYAKGTSLDDILSKAGLINMPTQKGLSMWPNISKEQIIAWNPDIILVPSWSYDKNKDPNKLAEDFKNDPSFKNLKAVKNNRVLMLPDRHLLDNAQYMADGVVDVAKAAYPDLFTLH